VAITFPIYIIGMPASGKSTIAKYLSNNLNIESIDTDQMIETKTGMSIKDIFQSHGESYFRQLETEILKSLKGFKGVVSTGGGIILNKKHCDMMKEGFVIYLDTPLEELKVRISKSNQRPKSISDHLETLYEQRYVLYKNCAHLIVFNHSPIEETIKHIMKHLEA
jgi:shikimate kinase